jgi:hypothetical protein
MTSTLLHTDKNQAYNYTTEYYLVSHSDKHQYVEVSRNILLTCKDFDNLSDAMAYAMDEIESIIAFSKLK